MRVPFGSALVFAVALLGVGGAQTIPAFAAVPVQAVDAEVPSAQTSPQSSTQQEMPVAQTAAPAAAHPAAAAPAINNSPAANPAIAGSSFGLASGMVFLLAMVLVAAWLIKRSGGMPSWRSGGSMKVVAALSVGPRERVVLIEMGGQQWLLGVTPNAINPLHHFPEPIIAAGSADEFSNKLRQLLPQGFGR